jgi:hypothetical protein
VNVAMVQSPHPDAHRECRNSPTPLIWTRPDCKDVLRSGVKDCDLISGHESRVDVDPPALMVCAHGRAPHLARGCGQPWGLAGLPAVDAILSAITSLVMATSKVSCSSNGFGVTQRRP